MSFSLSFHSPFQPASGPTSSLHDTVRDSHLVQYAILGAFALQIYDYIITLDEEIRFIWLRRSPFSRRIVFLLNRYLPFITASSTTYFLLFNTNQSFCRPAHFAVAEIAVAGAVIAECTLFLRTYAIYERNKVVLALLSSLALITTAGSFINTAYYVSRSSALDIGVPHRGCLFWYRLKIEWVSVVALIFCESVSLFLLIKRTIWYCRHSTSNIMVHICKDSIFYFICIIGYSIVNLLIQLFASSLLCDALLIPQSIVHQILCTRFLLRIRRLSEDSSFTVERFGHESLGGSGGGGGGGGHSSGEADSENL